MRLKNAFLHALLISVFSFMFAASARPVAAFGMAPFSICTSVFQCYIVAALGIITYSAWVLFLISGIYGCYKTLQTGKLYIGVISIICLLLGVLTSPIYIQKLLYILATWIS